MKTFQRLFILLALFLPFGIQAQVIVINASVAVTNSTGTTNGQTLVINGNTLTWTNLVQVPASQILTNNTPTGAATNMFVQLSQYPNAGLSVTYGSSTSSVLKSFPGQLLTVTVSAGWGTVTYSTNYLTNAYILRLPILVEQPGQQTNLASMLVTAIEFSTNSFSPNDVAHSNYVSLSTVQGISGNKAFTGASNYFASAFILAPSMTNATNFGNAFSSPGSAPGSQQFGGGQALGTNSLSIGPNSSATSNFDIAIGFGSSGSGGNDVAAGAGAVVQATNGTAVGRAAFIAASHSNSSAFGAFATTTAANQNMIGSPGISTVVNNILTVGSSENIGAGLTIANGITNLLTTGTNTFPAGSDISFARFAVTTLANGNNAAVPIGTNVFIQVSGPSGAFTINGINASPNRDGKFIMIKNATGQSMTIANNSGGDPTAANRILTGYNADHVYTNNPGFVTLIYDGATALWNVVSQTGNQ